MSCGNTESKIDPRRLAAPVRQFCMATESFFSEIRPSTLHFFVWMRKLVKKFGKPNVTRSMTAFLHRLFGNLANHQKSSSPVQARWTPMTAQQVKESGRSPVCRHSFAPRLWRRVTGWYSVLGPRHMLLVQNVPGPGLVPSSN